jgi:hypothetical protein
LIQVNVELGWVHLVGEQDPEVEDAVGVTGFAARSYQVRTSSGPCWNQVGEQDP